MTRRNPLLAKPPKGFNRMKRPLERLDKLDGGVNLTRVFQSAAYYARQLVEEHVGGDYMWVIVKTDCPVTFDYDTASAVVTYTRRGFNTTSTLAQVRADGLSDELVMMVADAYVEPNFNSAKVVAENEQQWQSAANGRWPRTMLHRVSSQYRCKHDVEVCAAFTSKYRYDEYDTGPLTDEMLDNWKPRYLEQIRARGSIMNMRDGISLGPGSYAEATLYVSPDCEFDAREWANGDRRYYLHGTSSVFLDQIMPNRTQLTGKQAVAALRY